MEDMKRQRAHERLISLQHKGGKDGLGNNQYQLAHFGDEEEQAATPFIDKHQEGVSTAQKSSLAPSAHSAAHTHGNDTTLEVSKQAEPNNPTKVNINNMVDNFQLDLDEEMGAEDLNPDSKVSPLITVRDPLIENNELLQMAPDGGQSSHNYQEAGEDVSP